MTESFDIAAAAAGGERGEKQQLIAAAACKLFLEHGYEVTSMDAVAAEAGVSKRTVYSHFGSKEQLFVEVMHEMCDAAGEGAIDGINTDLEPAAFLETLTRFVMAKVSDPGVQSVMRTIISESQSFPDMGQRFWAIGPSRSRDALTAYLAARHADGTLHVPDPRLSASQFQAMIAGPQFMPMLFTGSPEFTPDEVDRMTRSGIAMFLAAHQPRG
jgi:AcrR family transcriptional regulator